MRHGDKVNNLGRKKAHRDALLSNLATSLIMHKRINTTVAKAKALRKYVEPLITKSKDDTTHSRRTVFSYLGHKDPIKELFSVVADKVADRPGGYTRIIRTGLRLGDNAETCIIELVDFNEIYNTDSKKKEVKKRTRRGSAKKDELDVEKVTETVKPAKAKTPKVEKPSEIEVVSEVKEEVINQTDEHVVEKDETSDEARKED